MADKNASQADPDDRDLLALADEWQRVSANEDAAARSLHEVERRCVNAEKGRVPDEARQQFQIAEAECSALRRRIAMTQAQTFRGIRFKASVVAWCHGSDLDEMERAVRIKIEAEKPYGPTSATKSEAIVVDFFRLWRLHRSRSPTNF